jgi:hypothetical protein
MKLVVPTPPGWSRLQLVEGELLRSPDRKLSLFVLPLEGAKLVATSWLWSALVYRVPANVEPTNIVNGQLTTAFGWTALTVEADFGTEARRFVAYFSFLDLSATVIATCTDLELAEWRDVVIWCLYHASPDFSGDRISGVAALLGGAPPTARHFEGMLLTEPWRRAFSGGDVVLVPRLEPDSGVIRRTAGLTPLRSVAQLFSDFDMPPELGITQGGDYFAIAAQHDQRVLAIVFGADSYTRIEASVLVPDRFEMFLTAVRGLTFQELSSGAGRPRPYYYEAPAGWDASARAGSTLWISPTCARSYHVLRVFEARPAEREDIVRRRRFETVSAEFLATPPLGPAVFYSNELEVRVFKYNGRFGGSELSILDATVTDETYCYPLRVEFDASLIDASMQLIEDVVRTIVPLPSLVIEEHDHKPDAFAHWGE